MTRKQWKSIVTCYTVSKFRETRDITQAELTLDITDHHKIKVDYCTDYPILKQLILMQMLPSSTIQPKAAMHFAVFEKLMSLKLYGSLSNFAFVKSQNADNLLLSNYGENDVS